MPPRPPRFASEVRGVAILRAALVPIALLSVSSADQVSTRGAYPWVIGALALYAVIALAVAFTGHNGQHVGVLLAVADLGFVAALVATTGGPRSPVQYAFYVLPIAAAVRLSPRLTAAWSALALAAYLVVAVPDPQTALPGDWDLLLADSLSLLWISGAAVMLSVLLGWRQRTLAELAQTRRALVQQALDAEATERRRLAEELHDNAIQNVLAARQEIRDVERGRPGAAERLRAALDETDRQLRAEVFQMHPLGLERAGLSAVLESLAQQAAARGGFTATVTVDPALEHAPVRELLVSTARELLANAAKHAHARTVTVAVTRTEHGDVGLDVTDDGDGIPEGRLQSAVRDRHIGLAALVERARAADGELRISSTPGQGTRVTLHLPPETPGDAW